MKRTTLAIAAAAALLTAACLQKDTASTIYLRQDGSFDWVILEQNVRSDERDDSARLAEEARYLDGVSRGDSGMVNSLLDLGARTSGALAAQQAPVRDDGGRPIRQPRRRLRSRAGAVWGSLRVGHHRDRGGHDVEAAY